MELEPNTVVDRYRVGEVLGRGGMAIVYRVEHESLGSTHALKLVLSPREATRERLMQEGRAQSQLRHRNIVAVTDVISVFGAPGLVLEYIDGPALDAFLERHRPTVAQADALARGILAGVGMAHAAGVLHRDLKPANILLAWEEGHWIPKIADFGVAKLANDERLHQTRTGAGLGTPMYMAPEQTRDASRVDERADVFAVGAVLYELLMGHQAFSGADLVELFQNIREGRYPTLDPELPERMRDAITSALEPDPERRCASIAALTARWCADQPLEEPAWPVPVQQDVRVVTGSSSQASQTFDTTGVPSSPTLFPGMVTSEPTQPTFDPNSLDPQPASAPPTLVEATELPTAPPARKRRVPVAVVLAIGGLLAVGAWWGWPQDHALGAGAIPAIYAAAVPQQDFERGWRALLDADYTRAEQVLTRLTEEPGAPATTWALLAMVRAGQEQVGPAHQAMWKAVERAEGAEGVHATVLQLQGRARRKGWTEVLPAMQAHAEAHPDDLLVQWVASWSLPPEHAGFAEANAARMLEAAPEHPYPWTQVVRVALAYGTPEQSSEPLTRALSRFPGHPALLVLAGEAAVVEGDLEEARRALTEALRFAPGLFAARHRLAEVTLLLGDEAQTQALISASLAPSEPTAQRTAFCYRMAMAFAGLGRVREGHELLRTGAELARAEGDHLTRSWLLGTIALIELDAERYDVATANTDTLLTFAATTPELPEGERASMSRGLLEARAFIAARSGDLEEAEALLKRMQALDGVRASSVEWVQRDLASHRKDVAALDSLFEHAQPGCLGRWERARALALAGAHGPALEGLESLLTEQICGPVGAERWANALAFALAAQLTEEPARTAYIAGFDAKWPNPDGDLPVVARVASLR